MLFRSEPFSAAYSESFDGDRRTVVSRGSRIEFWERRQGTRGCARTRRKRERGGPARKNRCSSKIELCSARDSRRCNRQMLLHAGAVDRQCTLAHSATKKKGASGDDEGAREGERANERRKTAKISREGSKCFFLASVSFSLSLSLSLSIHSHLCPVRPRGTKESHAAVGRALGWLGHAEAEIGRGRRFCFLFLETNAAAARFCVPATKQKLALERQKALCCPSTMPTTRRERGAGREASQARPNGKPCGGLPERRVPKRERKSEEDGSFGLFFPFVKFTEHSRLEAKKIAREQKDSDKQKANPKMSSIPSTYPPVTPKLDPIKAKPCASGNVEASPEDRTVRENEFRCLSRSRPHAPLLSPSLRLSARTHRASSTATHLDELHQSAR